MTDHCIKCDQMALRARALKRNEVSMTIPELEPVDLADPDLDDLLARHDAQVQALLLRRDQLERWRRHPAGRGNLAAELAIVNEELAALGVTD